MSGASEVLEMGRSAERDADFSAYLAARQPALLRTAYLLTGDPHTAEDVLQTVLARLYLSWERVRSADSPDAYVRRALVNETTSLWRRPWRRREVVAERLPEPTPSTDEYDGLAALLWTAVRSLPPRQRAVIVLRYYEQLSEAEIAHLLGIADGTVKSQASRALASLRASAPELRDFLEES